MNIITHSLAAVSLVALSASLTTAGHVTFGTGSTTVATATAPSTRSAGFTQYIAVDTVDTARVISHVGVLPTGASFGGIERGRAIAADRLRKLDD